MPQNKKNLLRCVWIRTNDTAQAPLKAVWLNQPRCPLKPDAAPAQKSTEQELWAYAA